ncbi:hypothetical protein E2562_038406 [Oryza meyeriana var. granulata]|uniref:Uncharacterized protein n=1 Tax=Oryza meyeriana var. granulata TaxID=110450 RepID=A0A6G1E907_9ORYZ|nr:hypothetical protein E2562_038406 [Oryza meyeriana var. granulata]
MRCDQDALWRTPQLRVSGAIISAEGGHRLRRRLCQRATQGGPALDDNPARVARQAVLPKCDAKGILERTSDGALGPVRIPGVDGEEAYQDGGTALAPGAGAAGGATNPWDSRRAGKHPRSPSPLKTKRLWPPPSLPWVTAPQCMAHDAEASGSSQPHNGEASRVLEPRTGVAGLRHGPRRGWGCP